MSGRLRSRCFRAILGVSGAPRRARRPIIKVSQVLQRGGERSCCAAGVTGWALGVRPLLVACRHCP